MSSKEITRREMLKKIGKSAIALSFVPTVSGILQAQGLGWPQKTAWASESPAGKAGELTYVTYGGPYGEAQMKVIKEPFEKATGIKVNFDTSGPTPAKILAQVQTGNVEWDLCDGEVSWLLQLRKANAIQELDYAIVNTGDLLPDAWKPIRPWGTGWIVVSYNLGWNTEALQPEQVPGFRSGQTWKEFWDVKKFPGRRGLQTLTMFGIIEYALLADGASISDLYPLDLDRAFASLDKVKPHIQLWSGDQTVTSQSLVNNELDLCQVTSGRLPVLARKGAPVKQHFNQAALTTGALVVPKGAPNAQNAMRYINFMLQPEVQAKFSEMIPYGPANLKAANLMDPGMLSMLNSTPEAVKKQFRVDLEWWGQNEPAVRERFTDWLSA